MNKTKLALLLGACSLVGVTAIYASYQWPSSALSSPHEFKAEWDYDGGQHLVSVAIYRAAYDFWNETVRVSAEVVVDEPRVIEGIWVETCNDTNNNGNIEVGEWALRATGSVASTMTKTIGTVAPVDVDVSFDGYRLRWEWEDGGVATELVLAPGLTAD